MQSFICFCTNFHEYQSNVILWEICENVPKTQNVLVFSFNPGSVPLSGDMSTCYWFFFGLCPVLPLGFMKISFVCVILLTNKRTGGKTWPTMRLFQGSTTTPPLVAALINIFWAFCVYRSDKVSRRNRGRHATQAWSCFTGLGDACSARWAAGATPLHLVINPPAARTKLHSLIKTRKLCVHRSVSCPRSQHRLASPCFISQMTDKGRFGSYPATEARTLITVLLETKAAWCVRDNRTLCGNNHTRDESSFWRTGSVLC